MALHYATAFEIYGSTADFFHSDWLNSQLDTREITYHETDPAEGFPRQPPIGYGGMEAGMRGTTGYIYVTPTPPRGTLADGGIQFHWNPDLSAFSNGTSYIQLYDGTRSTYLLELRGYGSNTVRVYSHNTLRGTATGLFLFGAWNVVAIRFKDHTVNGEIQVSVNGEVCFTYSGNTGGTSEWGALRWSGAARACGITWWDDAADDFLTTTYWTTSLTPSSDAADGDWWNNAGVPSQVDLYDYINDAWTTALSTPTYIDTVADPSGEVRIKVQTSEVDAGWAPAYVAGVLVQAAARGDGTIGQGTVTAYDGGTTASVDGTTVTLTSLSSVKAADVLALDPNGATWTLAQINACEFGFRAS